MKFLLTQIIVVILVCVFIATLSNLADWGFVGWIIAGSTGHALYKIYKHMHYSLRPKKSKHKCPTCNSAVSDFSSQLQSFMFDDVTGAHDD